MMVQLRRANSVSNSLQFDWFTSVPLSKRMKILIFTFAFLFSSVSFSTPNPTYQGLPASASKLEVDALDLMAKLDMNTGELDMPRIGIEKRWRLAAITKLPSGVRLLTMGLITLVDTRPEPTFRDLWNHTRSDQQR